MSATWQDQTQVLKCENQKEIVRITAPQGNSAEASGGFKPKTPQIRNWDESFEKKVALFSDQVTDNASLYTLHHSTIHQIRTSEHLGKLCLRLAMSWLLAFYSRVCPVLE